MNRIVIFICIFFSSYIAFAQNYVKHVVAKGETITQIAAKYKVTPFDIYKLNPDSQAGIKESDVILIPSSNTAKETPAPAQKPAASKTHIAKAKETLYSISRDYNVNVDDLKMLNADALKSGLKIGQEIKIPASAGTIVSQTSIPKKAVQENAVAVPSEKQEKADKSKTTFHIVEPKETKFGIAKKYGITVEELEKRNPSIMTSLPVGYKLSISGNPAEKDTPVAEKPKPVKYDMPAETTTKSEVVTKTKFNGFANYEVKPKETLFSLAKSFDITEDELIALNPTLKEGVKTGMILKVPGRGSMTIIPETSASKSDDLSKSIKTANRKQLALLLPFNAAKIQGDTLKTIAMRLKKDAFLNMTLDFYAGAMMAVDSAKVLGLNIDVRIFDSEESKMSSNVANVIQANHLENADAVIGPFYQQYVEKASELLSSKNVAVISPLSKESGKTFANLYQAMPPADCMKTAMMDFLVSKQGNIIVISDPKRLANKDFITKNYPMAKFAVLTETGALDVDNLKSQLIKDKTNYIVMDSEKTGMILSATTALLNELANFQIQLAIIEPNETLDYEEVAMTRLTILKMLYPSMTNDRETPETIAFENQFKRKNKVFPSQYAVRGFDITFDTMLRLSQGKSFAESANDSKTEQVEGKFEYAKKSAEGYVNKGIYILEYQDDLSVKQVN